MSDNPYTSRLSSAVSQAVTTLAAGYLDNGPVDRSSASKAALAEFRRHAGQRPVDAPLVFERSLTWLYPTLLSPDTASTEFATSEEEAAFQALTFFALHMQSAKTSVHNPDMSFGTACGIMYHQGKSASLKPRFDALLVANSFSGQLYHLRSLITLLRSKNLGFDYGQFAQDLRTLRHPQRRNGVLLRWGRDFAQAPYRAATETPQS